MVLGNHEPVWKDESTSVTLKTRTQVIQSTVRERLDVEQECHNAGYQTLKEPETYMITRPRIPEGEDQLLCGEHTKPFDSENTQWIRDIHPSTIIRPIVSLRAHVVDEQMGVDILAPSTVDKAHKHLVTACFGKMQNCRRSKSFSMHTTLQQKCQFFFMDKGNLESADQETIPMEERIWTLIPHKRKVQHCPMKTTSFLSHFMIFMKIKGPAVVRCTRMRHFTPHVWLQQLTKETDRER